MDKGKIESLLVEGALYSKVDISIDDVKELAIYFSSLEFPGLMENKYKEPQRNIVSFCPSCKTDRVFNLFDAGVKNVVGIQKRLEYHDEIIKMTDSEFYNSINNLRFNQTYHCTRNNEHTLYYDLLVQDNQIIKIGQYPSIVDLKGNVFKKYDKIIKREQLKELRTAEILAAHGYGIGAFIYFRRIIEQIVQERFDETKPSEKSADEFQKMKFGEKIKYLRNDLPDLLVKSANIYSIVSKGVHELNEDECLEMYPILRKGIELILDRVIEIKKKEQEEKEFTEMIGKLKGELKAPSK